VEDRMQTVVKGKRNRDSLVASKSVKVETIGHKIDKGVSPYIYLYIPELRRNYKPESGMFK